MAEFGRLSCSINPIELRRHADLNRKRRDLFYKLSNYYATEYDIVAVEDLDE